MKQRLKQLFEKPDIIFLTTISDLYAEKLKDNQAEDVKVCYFKKNLRRKLMNRLTGFNYTEVNRRYAVYPETLEIEDLIHKPVSFKKSLTLLSNAMKKKKRSYNQWKLYEKR